MKIVVFGLAITSSWGNGHATTYRALLRALHNRGHDIVFFERDQEWYTSNRDMPEPPFCTVPMSTILRVSMRVSTKPEARAKSPTAERWRLPSRR